MGGGGKEKKETIRPFRVKPSPMQKVLPEILFGLSARDGSTIKGKLG
jgi:hypothetical protein